VFNGDKFPELPTTTGTLLQIVTIDSGTAVRDFQSDAKSTQPDAPQAKGQHLAKGAGANGLPGRGRRGSITVTIDENGSTIPGGRDIDIEKAYVFSVAPLSADLKSKHANLQVGWLWQICKYELTSCRFQSQRELRKSLVSAIVCRLSWLRYDIIL